MKPVSWSAFAKSLIYFLLSTVVIGPVLIIGCISLVKFLFPLFLFKEDISFYINKWDALFWMSVFFISAFDLLRTYFAKDRGYHK